MTSIQQLWLLLGGSWALLEMLIVYKTRAPDSGTAQPAFRSAKWIWRVIVASLAAALAFKHLQWLPLPLAYWPRQVIALLVLSLGLALRFYAVASLGRLFSTHAIIQHRHVLIDHGPYHVIRHPAYSGLLISFFAAGLAMGDWLALLSLCCPPAYALAQRIRYEESLLVGHFGQVYYDYCRRTWKLLPGIY